MAQVKQVTSEGLHWVREELGGSLERVRGFIETYLETPSNPLPLQRSLVELHQIRGTLRMIQCDGAALLAEEMRLAVQDLLGDVDNAPEKAFEVLLGATLQLADYLDVLAAGERDNALVFLPLINELRVARGAAVMSESSLFTHYARLEMPDPDGAEGVDDVAARELADRRMPAFNAALLNVLKEQSPRDHLRTLGEIAAEMETVAGDTRGGRVFGAAAALLEALGAEDAALELEVKRLLGRLGQLLKATAQYGAEALVEAPEDLLFGLVYFAGNADSGGERVAALRAQYRLDTLLPDAASLERLRRRLRGPNTGLVARLSEAIKEDLAAVKNSIDLVVRAGDRAPVDLGETAAVAQRVADTLAMLGLEMLRRVVLNQVKAIEDLARGEDHGQDAWMDVALALLRVEESLDGALLRHMHGEGDEADPEAAAKPYQEIDAGSLAIFREALVNMSRVKTLIPDFIDGGNSALLAEAARLLHEVEAGLQVLQRDDGMDLLARLRAFVSSRAMLAARNESPRMLALADAIAAVEYYLEALQAGQARPQAAYERAVEHVAQLELAPAEADPVVEPAAAAEASEEPAEAAAVDPEIRDIFLEEAGEVLETLQRDVPAWAGNLSDRERLVGIRRAFHTLKGSGRMAGAQDIGEFGWALERLLNRCLEGAVEAGVEVAAVVSRAVDALPGLIEEFRAGREPTGLAPLIDEANRLAGVAEGGEEAPGGARYAESELFRVFRGDAKGHIATLRVAASEPAPVAADDATVRALHTLKGSAEAVHAHDIAALAGVLEHYAEVCRATRRAFDADDLALLDEAAAAFDAALTALDAGEAPDADGLAALTGRVEAASTQLPAEVVESTSDQALREVFTDEACDLVDTIESALADWRDNPGDEHHPRALKATCHTLKGSARTAEAGALGDVAQGLERYVAGHLEDGTAPDPSGFERLEEFGDGLFAMLDRFRREGQTGDAAPLLALLEPTGATADEAEPPMAETPAPAAEEEAPDVEPQTTPPAAEPPAPEPEGPAPDTEAQAPSVEIDPELVAIFGGEAAELMEAFDADLARWRERPDDAGPRDALLRTLHTLKGSARMAQLDPIGEVCHYLETRLTATSHAEPGVLDWLTTASESLHHALDRIEQSEDPDWIAAPLGDLLHEAGAGAGAGEATAEPEAAATEAEPPTSEAPPTTAEAEPPAPQAPPESATPAPAEAVSAPAAAGFDERLYWQPRQTEESARAALPETARIPVARLDEMLNEAGEISIVRSRLAQQNSDLQFQLREMLQTTNRLREQLRKLDMETEAQILARHEPETDRYQAEFDPLEMDRYSALHELSRGLGESATDLVSLHDSMFDLAEQGEALLVQQSRTNTSLQQGLMRTLMVPFSRQSQRLRRTLDQAAREQGREVRLDLEGIEAELDRNVLERIVAPMEHLLRNAVVHGIENGDERAARDKARTGHVGVRLYREGTQLVVDVEDDGRGLDFDAIRTKAVERGLLAPDSEIGDDDLAQFIFESGFSTARELTRTAGRGVGLDVVNAEIKQLGGTLTVDSRPGSGTRFTIRLPLTLAISQALLVRVGEERYAVPLGSVEGVTRAPRQEIATHLDAAEASFEYGEHQYRVRNLGTLLDVPDSGVDGEEGPANVPVLLVRTGERRTAFVVDGMLGSREIVVKPVGPQVATVPAVAGATIMADGEVVLILDVAALMQMEVRRAIRERGPERAETAADERPLVMVVDDSITIRRVSERFLTRHGFAVSTAKDGMDALAKLQAQPPDVVLLDIEMPRIDGFELATYMRNSETLHDTPIIMVTSRSGDKHRRRAETIGVDRFVTKPYQEEDLLAQINAVLGKRASGEGSHE